MSSSDVFTLKWPYWYRPQKSGTCLTLIHRAANIYTDLTDMKQLALTAGFYLQNNDKCLQLSFCFAAAEIYQWNIETYRGKVCIYARITFNLFTAGWRRCCFWFEWQTNNVRCNASCSPSRTKPDRYEAWVCWSMFQACSSSALWTSPKTLAQQNHDFSWFIKTHFILLLCLFGLPVFFGGVHHLNWLPFPPGALLCVKGVKADRWSVQVLYISDWFIIWRESWRLETVLLASLYFLPSPAN